MSRIILSNSIFQMHLVYCPRFKVSMSDKTLSLIQRLFSCNLHNYIEKIYGRPSCRECHNKTSSPKDKDRSH